MNVCTFKEKVYSEIQFNFSENFWKPCNPYRRDTPEFPAPIFTNSQVFKVTVCTSPIKEFLSNEAINVGKFIVFFIAEIHHRFEYKCCFHWGKFQETQTFLEALSVDIVLKLYSGVEESVEKRIKIIHTYTQSITGRNYYCSLHNNPEERSLLHEISRNL